MKIYAISRSVIKKLIPKLYWVLLIFSVSLITQPTLQAQDLCAQFGSTPATKPPINNGNSSSFGTGFTNEVLDISGTFTVSGAFKFERCTLRMAPGALINVTTTQDFDVLDCQIFCCGQMWQGIKMPNQGWLNYWRNTLEDATTALDITNPKWCLIHNNFFNSNDVSVRIRDFNDVCSFGIAGNNFNQNWVTMNAASSITGQNGQGYAIFWITNCSGLVPIGLDGYPLNVIHGYTGLGVLSDASRVCVQHTQMSGAGGFWFINAPWQSGVGVLAQANSDVCIHGLGFAATSPFTFTSYPKAAVYADNSTLRCYNSFIQRVWRFGIQVHNTKNHWFDIANNRLIANGSGLGLSTAFVISTEKGTSGNSHIRGNIIDQMNNSLNSAIRVPDGSSSQTLLEIESNDITFHTGKGALLRRQASNSWQAIPAITTSWATICATRAITRPPASLLPAQLAHPALKTAFITTGSVKPFSNSGTALTLRPLPMLPYAPINSCRPAMALILPKTA